MEKSESNMQMSMSKITVIISVYNMEKYLNQCLDSIIDQTMTDIEIICVDDGATDSSSAILQEYAESDCRIKVITQENKGAAAARNAGIEAASGEYLFFIDADDFYEPDTIEKAYNAAKEHESDIVVFRSNFFNQKKNRYEENTWSIMPELLPNNPFSANDIPEKIFNIGAGWASDKIFKKSLIDEYGIRFQEIRTTNDMLFTYYAYVKAASIFVLDETLGHVRIHAHESLSVTREQSWDNVYLALLALKEKLVEENVYEKYKQSFVNWALNLLLWHIHTLKKPYAYQLRGKCVSEYFEKLDISGQSELYFYNSDEYRELTDMQSGNIKVSVIVPTYNVSNYIRQCADNILAQTLQDIEIIFVDDGSTDDTPWILREYEERDHRIRVIEKDHTNAGEARNVGKEEAVGEYLSFLDADDFFEPTMLELAYNKAKEEDSDVVLFRSNQYIHDKGEFRDTPWTLRDWEMPQHRPFSAMDASEKVFNMSSCTAWDKLFKREFIEKNQIAFQSNYVSNDMLFTFDALSAAERISTVEDILAHQRVGYAKKRAKDIEYITSCYYNALMALKKRLIERGVYDTFQKSYVNWALDFSLFNMHIFKSPFSDLIRQQLKLQYFDNMDILDLQKEDFYNHDQYIELQQLISERPEQTDDEQPKVSVILPIYNVSQYLRLALDSAVYQTMENIEIICVNDGSTDNCLEIINEYAQNDPRVKVITGENHGYGYAMNRGLEAATGEYIGIIEPDDFVDVNMFGDLYQIAKSNDLDFVKGDFYRFKHDPNGDLILYLNQIAAFDDNYDEVYSPSENINWLKYIMNTWCGIYNRDWLLSNGIDHNETPGASYQDNGFFFKTHIFSCRSMNIRKPYYMNRRDNPNSSVYNKEKIHATDTEFDLVYRYLKDNGHLSPSNMKRIVQQKIAGHFATIYRTGEQYKRNYVKSIAQELRNIMSSGSATRDAVSKDHFYRSQIIACDEDKYYYEKVQNKIKVSVILPIYNQQKYLRQCLDSLLNQSLKNIEIICVNDGSTDKTECILEEYKGIDDRIIVVNQPNQGAGAARNNGMEYASGEYLSFLDPDDFFDKHLLKLTTEKADKVRADICLYKTWLYDNETKKEAECTFRINDKFTPQKLYFNASDVSGNIFLWVNGTASDKLIRRDFVLSNGLSFQEQRTTNDAFFAYAAIFKASRITIVDKPLYHERRNNKASLSNTRHLSWKCYYHALLKHRENLKSMGLFSSYEKDFVNYALANSLWNYKTLPMPEKEELRSFLVREGFDELGIQNKGQYYFDDQNNYADYIALERSADNKKPETVISVILFLDKANFRKCIESILSQTNVAIEIIFIDLNADAINHNIAKEYARNYSNISFLPNAMIKADEMIIKRSAVEYAKGKYIYFADPHTILDNNCISSLVSIMEKEKLDLIQFNAVNSGMLKQEMNHFKAYPKIYYGGEYLEAMSNSEAWEIPMCLQLIRRDTLERVTKIAVESAADKILPLLNYIYSARITYLNQLMCDIEDGGQDYRFSNTEKSFVRMRDGISLMQQLVDQMKIIRNDSRAFSGLHNIYKKTMTSLRVLYEELSVEEKQELTKKMTTDETTFLNVALIEF